MEYNSNLLGQLMKETNLNMYQRILDMKSSSQMPKDRVNFISATKDQLEYYVRVKNKELHFMDQIIRNIKRKLDLNEADYEDLRQKFNKLHTAYRTNGQCEDLKRLLNKTCAAHKKISEQKTAADEKNAELEQMVSDLQNKFANNEKQTECLEEKLKAAVAQNQDVQKKFSESEQRRESVEKNLLTCKRKYCELEESHKKSHEEFKRQKVDIVYHTEFKALESLSDFIDSQKQILLKRCERMTRESHSPVPLSSDSTTTTSNQTEPNTTTDTSISVPAPIDVERSVEAAISAQVEATGPATDPVIAPVPVQATDSILAPGLAPAPAPAPERQDKKKPNLQYSWIRKLVNILIPNDLARQEALYDVFNELPRGKQTIRYKQLNFASLKNPTEWSRRLADIVFGRGKSVELNYLHFVENWVNTLETKQLINDLVSQNFIQTIYHKNTKKVVEKIMKDQSKMNLCMQSTLRALLSDDST